MVNKAILNEMREWESKIEPLLDKLYALMEHNAVITGIDLKRGINQDHVIFLEVRIFCTEWKEMSGFNNCGIYFYWGEGFTEELRESSYERLSKVIEALEARNYGEAFNIIMPNFYKISK